MKRLIIALMAVLLSVLGPTSAAFAGDAGGSTGADGTGAGSGTSIGSGAPPATGTYPPGVTGMDIAAASQYSEWWKYEYRASCPAYNNPKAPGTNYEYHFKKQWVNGVYRDVLINQGCLGAPRTSIVLYEHQCVVRNTITVEMKAPSSKLIGGSPITKTTSWGAATNKTVALCDQSRVSNLTASVPVKEIGQYRAVGTSRVDKMWVERTDGGSVADKYYDHAFSHNAGMFDTKYTMTCQPRWIVGSWVAYQGLPGCATAPTIPTTEPPAGVTPSISTPNYKCNAGNASLDSKTDPIVDIMRDGKVHSLRWAPTTVTGTGVKNVVAKSTYFDIWNAPKRDGGTFNGNTFELKQGTKHLVPTGTEYKPNTSGYGKSSSITGTAPADYTLKVFKSTERDKPMKITPVHNFTADVNYQRLNVTFDLKTGAATYTTVTDTRNETIICRGETITTNVLKAMNDNM